MNSDRRCEEWVGEVKSGVAVLLPNAPGQLLPALQMTSVVLSQVNHNVRDASQPLITETAGNCTNSGDVP